MQYWEAVRPAFASMAAKLRSWHSSRCRSPVSLRRLFAFDLLMSDGKDLRTERLTDRKHELRRLLSKVPESRMQYVEHVEQHGKALFERVCKLDLEGIVAKHGHDPYITEPKQTTWFKIKNRNYSQMEGREKLFERERHQEPAPGWHGCDLACAEVEQECAG
jgi:ATP-dependent DNA ligase